MGGAKQSKGEDSQLKEEPAYFDCMHSCVQLYKTLTMWAYHPAIRKMMTLAIMEAPHKNTYYIKFFELFQEAMREYLGDDTYQWELNSLMMDEKDANFKAIENVFSADFVDHYTMTFNTISKNVQTRKCVKERFLMMREKNFVNSSMNCWKLQHYMEASTLHEYHNICREIEKGVKRYGLSGWWHWWKPRGFHLLPALRGFNLPKTNYAESSQSKLKRNRKISVIESVFEDSLDFLIQEADYKHFLNNTE